MPTSATSNVNSLAQLLTTTMATFIAAPKQEIYSKSTSKKPYINGLDQSRDCSVWEYQPLEYYPMVI